MSFTYDNDSSKNIFNILDHFNSLDTAEKYVRSIFSKFPNVDLFIAEQKNWVEVPTINTDISSITEKFHYREDILEKIEHDDEDDTVKRIRVLTPLEEKEVNEIMKLKQEQFEKEKEELNKRRDNDSKEKKNVDEDKNDDEDKKDDEKKNVDEDKK